MHRRRHQATTADDDEPALSAALAACWLTLDATERVIAQSLNWIGSPRYYERRMRANARLTLQQSWSPLVGWEHDALVWAEAATKSFFLEWDAVAFDIDEIERLARQYFEGIDVRYERGAYADGTPKLTVWLESFPEVKSVFCGEDPDKVLAHKQYIAIQCGTRGMRADAMFSRPAAKALAYGFFVYVREQTEARREHG